MRHFVPLEISQGKMIHCTHIHVWNKQLLGKTKSSFRTLSHYTSTYNSHASYVSTLPSFWASRSQTFSWWASIIKRRINKATAIFKGKNTLLTSFSPCCHLERDWEASAAGLADSWKAFPPRLYAHWTQTLLHLALPHSFLTTVVDFGFVCTLIHSCSFKPVIKLLSDFTSHPL